METVWVKCELYQDVTPHSDSEGINNIDHVSTAVKLKSSEAGNANNDEHQINKNTSKNLNSGETMETEEAMEFKIDIEEMNFEDQCLSDSLNNVSGHESLIRELTNPVYLTNSVNKNPLVIGNVLEISPLLIQISIARFLCPFCSRCYWNAESCDEHLKLSHIDKYLSCDTISYQNGTIFYCGLRLVSDIVEVNRYYTTFKVDIFNPQMNDMQILKKNICTALHSKFPILKLMPDNISLFKRNNINDVNINNYLFWSKFKKCKYCDLYLPIHNQTYDKHVNQIHNNELNFSYKVNVTVNEEGRTYIKDYIVEQQSKRNSLEQSHVFFKFAHCELKCYLCTYCSQEFGLKDACIKHLKQVHSQCLLLNYNYIEYSKQLFRCNLCVFAFDSLSECRKHAFSCNVIESRVINSVDTCIFICTLCKLDFKSKDELCSHQNYIHKTLENAKYEAIILKLYICNKCCMMFNLAYLLYNHICKMATNSIDNTLNKVFVLQNDMIIDTLKNSTICSPVNFKDYRILTMINMAHASRDKHTITVNQNVNFNFKTIAMHLFSCPQCEQCFVNNSELVEHGNVSHCINFLETNQVVKQVFICKNCNGIFQSTENCMKHINICHSLKYYCSSCKLTFLCYDTYFKHVVDNHCNYVCKIEDQVTYGCFKCNEIFQSLALLEPHMQECWYAFTIYTKDNNNMDSTLLTEPSQNTNMLELQNVKAKQKTRKNKNWDLGKSVSIQKPDNHIQPSKKSSSSSLTISKPSPSKLKPPYSKKTIKIISCVSCLAQFHKFQHFSNHLKKCHPGNIKIGVKSYEERLYPMYTCQVCLHKVPKQFFSIKSLEEHMLLHSIVLKKPEENKISHTTTSTDVNKIPMQLDDGQTPNISEVQSVPLPLYTLVMQPVQSVFISQQNSMQLINTQPLNQFQVENAMYCSNNVSTSKEVSVVSQQVGNVATDQNNSDNHATHESNSVKNKNKPRVVKEKFSLETSHKNNVQHSKNKVQHSKNDVQHSKNDVQHSKNNVQHSKNDVQHSKNNVQHNKNDVQHNKKISSKENTTDIKLCKRPKNTTQEKRLINSHKCVLSKDGEMSRRTNYIVTTAKLDCNNKKIENNSDGSQNSQVHLNKTPIHNEEENSLDNMFKYLLDGEEDLNTKNGNKICNPEECVSNDEIFSSNPRQQPVVTDNKIPSVPIIKNKQLKPLVPQNIVNNKIKQCQECHSYFIDNKTLDKHIHQIHSNNVSETCSICSVTFSSHLDFTAHTNSIVENVYTKINNTTLKCQLCLSSFFQYNDIHLHLKNEHNCQIISDSLFVQTNEALFACEMCNKSGKSYNINNIITLASHLHDLHGYKLSTLDSRACKLSIVNQNVTRRPQYKQNLLKRSLVRNETTKSSTARGTDDNELLVKKKRNNDIELACESVIEQERGSRGALCVNNNLQFECMTTKNPDVISIDLDSDDSQCLVQVNPSHEMDKKLQMKPVVVLQQLACESVELERNNTDVPCNDNNLQFEYVEIEHSDVLSIELTSDDSVCSVECMPTKNSILTINLDSDDSH